LYKYCTIFFALKRSSSQFEIVFHFNTTVHAPHDIQHYNVTMKFVGSLFAIFLLCIAAVVADNEEIPSSSLRGNDSAPSRKLFFWWPTTTYKSPCVNTLKLVNTLDGNDIMDVHNGSIIDLSKLVSFGITSLFQLNFRADTGYGTTAVSFGWNSNKCYRNAFSERFSLCGDSNGLPFFGCNDLTFGDHCIAATPHAGSHGLITGLLGGILGGTKGVTFNVCFKVIKGGPPPVSPPVRAPVPAPVPRPVPAPVRAPVSAPVSAPVRPPVRAPVSAPVSAPVRPPVRAPVSAPVSAPVRPPVRAPVSAPVPKVPTSTGGFVIKDITGSFEVLVTARFDNVNGFFWQRIFDFGNGPGLDNIWLGQCSNSNNMILEVWRDNKMYRVTAHDAIVKDETATWKVGVDANGLMWIEKNGCRLAHQQGIVPANVHRVNKFIGKSNWPTDSPLNGAVTSICVTNK
jgi:hypothetical protein